MTPMDDCCETPPTADAPSCPGDGPPATPTGLEKTDAPTPICYCFGYTREDIVADVRAHGDTDIQRVITGRVKAGECYCEKANPSGRCCLGDVARAIKAARAQLEEGKRMQTAEQVELVALALIDTMSPKVMPAAMVPIAVDIMTRIAAGHRVTPDELGKLAPNQGDPTSLAAALAAMGMAELDDDGAIIGMIVTATPTRHRFETGGHSVHTWCAVDTLFMPAVLDCRARVESSCPRTRTTIRLDVHPDRVAEVTPAAAYVSFVAPGVTEGVAPSCGGGADGLTGTEGSFCANANFFADCTEARTWQAEHLGSIVLPVDEGFELARRIWSEPFRAALDDG